MATYLHLFNSQSEYDSERNSHYNEPWVSATNVNNDYRVDYNPGSPE